jgi:hypothetical protein
MFCRTIAWSILKLQACSWELIGVVAAVWSCNAFVVCRSSVCNLCHQHPASLQTRPMTNYGAGMSSFDEVQHMALMHSHQLSETITSKDHS